MPTVPRGQQGTQRERPVQTILTSGQAPVEAFGGGAEQVIQEQRKIAGGLVSSADQELDRANNLWFLETENQITAKQLDIETRAKQRRGKDAFGLHDDTKKEFDDFVKNIKTNNETQKDGLSRISAARGGSLNRTITGHVSNEVEEVENQESDAYKFNLTNSAMAHYDDPVRATEDLELFEGQIVDDIARKGLDKEAAKAFKLQSLSDYHSAVVGQILEDGNDLFADAYVEQFKDEFTEDAKNKLKPAIEEAGLRAKSQAATDKIIVSIPGDDGEDWKKRFDQAKKIKDPKLRDEVSRRLKSEFSLQKELERQIDNDSYMSALNQVEANAGQHPKDIVGAGRWSNFTKAQRDSLIRMSNVNETTMDFKIYREFNALTVTEKANLNEAELNEKYLSHFDPTFRDRAINSWLADSKSVDSGSFIKDEFDPYDHADNFLKDEEFLLPNGKLKDEDNETLYNTFQTIYNRKVIAFQKENGKLPDEAQSKEMAQQTYEESVRIDGETKKFKELEKDEIEQRAVPFARTKDGVVTKGLTATDVQTIRNTLRSFNIVRPVDFDKRASDDDVTEIDDLYSELIQRYASAISEKDTFRANQLVRKYKKDLKELTD